MDTLQAMAAPFGKFLLLALIVTGPFVCALIQVANASRSRQGLASLAPAIMETQAWRNADKYFERRIPDLGRDENASSRRAFRNSLVFLSVLLFVLFVPILFMEHLGGIWKTKSFMLGGVFLSGIDAPQPKLEEYQITTMAVAAIAVIAAYVRLLFDITIRFNTDQFTSMQVIFSITKIATAPLVAILGRHVVHALSRTAEGAPLVAEGVVLAFCVLLAVLSGIRPDIWLASLVQACGQAIGRIPVFALFTSPEQPAPPKETLPEAKPLSLVPGLGQDQAAKLAEIDILDCQRLAATNPLVIWVRTTFSLLDVLELAGRAILAVAYDARDLAVLRGLGVRSVLHLRAMDTAQIEALAAACGQDPGLFAVHVRSLLAGPVALDLIELTEAAASLRGRPIAAASLMAGPQPLDIAAE